MANKHILLLTHTRSCSTAFERIFMTRHESIQCIHEPFGDPFYFGPEKISPAFADNPEKCERTGHANSTYASSAASIEDTISGAEDHGRRVFIKDMAYHIIPCYPHLDPSTASPSLSSSRTAAEDARNPSLLPWSFLDKFQITFLIRNPEQSIPSKYRFTVPPLNETSGMKRLYEREIGYRELRLMFDFLRDRRRSPGQETSTEEGGIVIVDAEDLLSDPAAAVRTYCERVGVDFDDDTLRWDRKEDVAVADQLLAKYRPYHLDALESKGFESTTGNQNDGRDERDRRLDDQWKERFGVDGAKLLRDVVSHDKDDYLYLREFRLRA